MSAEDRPPALDVAGLSVSLDGRPVLTEVSFVVRPGELVGLAGPNGSGKSTLLRAALGMVPAQRGRVLLSGAEVAELPVRRRARWAAWMPQNESPQDNVPAFDYVLFGRYAHLAPYGGEGPEDRQKAEEALRAVDLWDRREAGILELSGGERQRALLARALAQDAPLLLLDEPTAHLDIGHQLDLLRRIRALVRERGTAVIAALHDLNLAARFVDRVLVLSRGRLVEDGSPAEVLSPEILREVWGIVAELQRDPRSGQPFLIPTLPATPGRPPSRERGPVHVVGGGGTASPILPALAEAGWRLTAGVLPLFDTDTERTQELQVPTVVDLPFTPITAGARERLRPLLARAQAIVVAPIPVGPSNLGNLEELVARSPPVPVLLFEPDGWEGRDFTGGLATQAREALLQGGARSVRTVPELLEALDSVAGVAPPRGPPGPAPGDLVREPRDR